MLDGGSVLFVVGSVDGRDFYDLLGDFHGYAMLYGVLWGRRYCDTELLEDLKLSCGEGYFVVEEHVEYG